MISTEKVSAMPKPKSHMLLPHLRAWRLHATLTQEGLAEKAEVGHATVVRAELGREVAALTAAKLAKALGITMKQLQNEEPE